MGAVGQSSDWRILKMSSLSFMSFHVQGGRVLSKWWRYDLFPLLTAQNYCNFSKLPTFYLLFCIVFIPKACFHPPPILICINPLVLFVHQTWNGNNALLVGKASSLLPSSPRVFCPLLSYSLSSVSLREFFGVAHLITVAGQTTSYYRNVLLLFFLVMAQLERAQFYAWLIGFSPFSCDRFLIVCPWFSFQHAFLWKRTPQIVVKPCFWCSTFVVNSAG